MTWSTSLPSHSSLDSKILREYPIVRQTFATLEDDVIAKTSAFCDKIQSNELELVNFYASISDC
jgi:hypothetical protein